MRFAFAIAKYDSTKAVAANAQLAPQYFWFLLGDTLPLVIQFTAGRILVLVDGGFFAVVELSWYSPRKTNLETQLLRH